MAEVRFVGPEPHEVPELGIGRWVEPDELVTVPDGRYEAYLLQPHLWEGVTEPVTPDPPAEPEPPASNRAGQVPAADTPPATPAESIPAPAAKKTTAKTAAAPKGSDS